MASKRKVQSEVSSDAALAAQLSTAEAHWQQQKLAARAAKAAAKDAKKAVKRLRKLLLASNEEKKAAMRKPTTPAKRSRPQDRPSRKSADAKTLRIAGTPEVRPRPAKKRTVRRKPENEPPVIELQARTADQPGAAEQTSAVPSSSDGDTQ